MNKIILIWSFAIERTENTEEPLFKNLCDLCELCGKIIM